MFTQTRAINIFEIAARTFGGLAGMRRQDLVNVGGNDRGMAVPTAIW